MSTMASQITSLTIVYSNVYSGTDQRKYQSSASLALVRGIHRWPVSSPHKGPITQKRFPFDDSKMAVISNTVYPMICTWLCMWCFFMVLSIVLGDFMWIIYQYSSGFLHWHCVHKLTLKDMGRNQPFSNHNEIDHSEINLFVPGMHLDIEAKTKWLKISRWHFSMHFLEWKCTNFDWDFTEVRFQGSINNIPDFGSDQATSHYLNQWWLVYWCIYASLGLNDLIIAQYWSHFVIGDEIIHIPSTSQANSELSYLYLLVLAQYD